MEPKTSLRAQSKLEKGILPVIELNMVVLYFSMDFSTTFRRLSCYGLKHAKHLIN